MANRRTVTKVVLANQAVSSTTVYTSSWFPVESFQLYGGQITFTGTMTGTLTVEVSYDAPRSLEGMENTPVNFNAVSFMVNNAVAANIAISGAATKSFEIGADGAVSANWARIKYTNATNSGTIVSATMVGKAQG